MAWHFDAHTSSHRLLHDDLKESGLLPVLARLVKGFNWRHQPRRHALDLVAAVHVVLRMLHHLNSCGACPVLSRVALP